MHRLSFLHTNAAWVLRRTNTAQHRATRDQHRTFARLLGELSYALGEAAAFLARQAVAAFDALRASDGSGSE